MSEGSPKVSKSPSMGGTPGSPAGSPTGVTLLRKKNKAKGDPFGAASKLMGAVADQVESLGKKVTTGLTLDSIAQSFSGGSKGKMKEIVQTAPVGVTQSFSMVLSHIVAPLWSVGAKPLGVHRPLSYKNPEIREFAASLDSQGFELEDCFEQLRTNPELSTAYITILIKKLLAIETSGDIKSPLFAEIPSQIGREVSYKGEYEEHYNDETVAHDQAGRLVTEVGGTWKPRGAADLPHFIHEVRHRLLVNAFRASVCLNYLYTDEGLQHFADALAGQLFLLSYSEGIVSLVAGIKNAAYTAKFLVHLAAPLGSLLEQDCILPTPYVESVLLQDCTNICNLAVENLMHRNDTGDILIAAMTRGVSICPPNSLASLFAIYSRVLHRIYAVDLHALSLLLDAVRPYLVHPVPVGTTAMVLTQQLRQSIMNANHAQRALASRIMVAGKEMKSFRCQPVHIVTTPYCARAHNFSSIYIDKIDLQRGPSQMYPAITPSGHDPATATPFQGGLLDDSVLYIANQTTNVFQSLYELAHGYEESPANEIELANLFSVQPSHLCQYFPTLFNTLAEHSMGEHEKTQTDLINGIVEAYLGLMDSEKPAKGVRRFRCESPRVPFLPLLPSVAVETDEQNEVVKGIIDKHWRYCDQRVLDKEASFLHPERDLSLSHFIEPNLKLVVCGGGGLLRRMLTSVLSMKATYPGAVPDFCFYVIPFGYNNDLASWLARCDPLYMQSVLGPFQMQHIKSGDAPTAESMTATAAEDTQTSLMLRRTINNFVVDAVHKNDVIVYQAECVSADGTVNYIPFVSNLEVGIHLNIAAKAEGGFPPGAKEMVSGTTFSVEAGNVPSIARAKSNYQSFKSQPSFKSNASFASADGNLTNASFTSAASFAGGAGGGLGSSSYNLTSYNTTHTVTFGTTTETMDRVLVRMHGTRGIPLSTRKHLTESGDVRICAAGVDVLDWISTTYHVYDSSSAVKSAQALLDLHLLQCVCVPLGREPSKFSDAGLYRLCPKEDVDAIPTCPPCARSNTFESATAIRHGLEESSGSSQLPCMRMRVVYFPLEGDLTYTDLNEANCSTRDVVSLKLKSCGSGEDNGSLPNPTTTVLHMSVNEVEKKRSNNSSNSRNTREQVDRFEHYQLRYGDKKSVDPRCMLVIEGRPPHQSNPGADAASVGIFAAIDGDMFGPFTVIRVRPVTIKPTPENPDCNVATMSVMSFLPCVDRF